MAVCCAPLETIRDLIHGAALLCGCGIESSSVISCVSVTGNVKSASAGHDGCVRCASALKTPSNSSMLLRYSEVAVSKDSSRQNVFVFPTTPDPNLSRPLATCSAPQIHSGSNECLPLLRRCDVPNLLLKLACLRGLEIWRKYGKSRLML
jgi:hypothetical protein